MNENIAVLNELQEIIDKHENVIDDYNIALSKYSYKKMSRGVCLYGMYYPEHELEKYFKYKGKLTNNEKKKDFVYYFDENDNLILTERYADGVLLNLILFYYYEDLIEIVWYSLREKKINIVGKIVYQKNVFAKFVESGDVTVELNSFREFSFNTDDDYIYVKSYMKYATDKEILLNSKMKKNKT